MVTIVPVCNGGTQAETERQLAGGLPFSSRTQGCEQTPVDRGNGFGQVFCNQARTNHIASLAVQPHRRAGSLEGWHTLRAKTANETGQDVAGTCGCKIGRRVVCDGRSAVGCRDNGVGTLQYHYRACFM